MVWEGGRGALPGELRSALMGAVSLALCAGAWGCGSSNGTSDGGHGGSDGGLHVDGGRDAADPPVLTDGGTGVPPLDLSFSPDAFWAQDPPQSYCGLDGGTFSPPTPPGGTPQCPDDKNREGCPCPTQGATASCWPGLRKNRKLGACHDGTTTCQLVGETTLAWGPCTGYQLPDPGATSGPAACRCFSSGRWAIDDLMPCFFNAGGGFGSGGATSSSLASGTPRCPDTAGQVDHDWSPDTVTADCPGHFKLCYSLKAGDAENPRPGDCTLATVCTEGDYTTPGTAQPFPPLPGWAATSPEQIACAQRFIQSGGYGEMRVVGTTLTCDQLDTVFNRVSYCPFSCNSNPSDPACQGCGQGAGGTFQ